MQIDTLQVKNLLGNDDLHSWRYRHSARWAFVGCDSATVSICMKSTMAPI